MNKFVDNKTVITSFLVLGLIYFPFSYSFAGQVYVVKNEKIKALDMTAADAMKLVVSGGVTHF